MIRMRALKYSAREIATTWRCPPERRRTGMRMLVKFLLRRWNTLRACTSMKWSSSVFQARHLLAAEEQV